MAKECKNHWGNFIVTILGIFIWTSYIIMISSLHINSQEITSTLSGHFMHTNFWIKSHNIVLAKKKKRATIYVFSEKKVAIYINLLVCFSKEQGYVRVDVPLHNILFCNLEERTWSLFTYKTRKEKGKKG